MKDKEKRKEDSEKIKVLSRSLPQMKFQKTSLTVLVDSLIQEVKEACESAERAFCKDHVAQDSNK